MLQLLGSQRVGHDFTTEKQQIYTNHFAVYLNLTQPYRSTTFQFFNVNCALGTQVIVSSHSWSWGGSD